MPSHNDYMAKRDKQEAEAKEERARAKGLWQRLQSAGGPKEWKALLEEPEFQSWALCEKLCHESAALADDDTGRAAALAELAAEMAPKLTLDKERHAALQEYVWSHVGNVCRARGDLKGAEDAFRRADELDTLTALLPSVFERSRVLALEAALLRDQGKLTEAIRKIDLALSVSDSKGPGRPRVLLERARLYRWLGQPEQAREDLALALRLVPDTADPRLLLRLHLELGSILCDLGWPDEAGKLPANLMKEAEKLPVEQARLVALQGRIAAGLGRTAEAEAALEKLAGLPGRASNDVALLSLEVAALYASEGRPAELRELSERMLELLGAPDLSREAAATLKLFSRLAAQEKMNAERAAQFVRDFPRMVSKTG